MIGVLDIGGTKIAAGVAGEAGRIVARREAPTAGVRADGAVGMALLQELLAACIREAGCAIEGIGVSCTGPVDPFTGWLGNVDFLPGWAGRNLVQELAGAFGVRVAVENDADAGALAEAAWGAGRGAGRLLYCTVSTGIGGGFVVDGALYRGARGAHPEIGHHVVEAGGPPCSCGARGCWEALAAGPALAAWYRAQAGDGCPEDCDARRVCEMAAAGDAAAARAVEREAVYLGLGFANLINLLAPDTIALGGGVMRSWSLFEERCRATVRAHCVYVAAENTRITLAALGAETGLAGAACVWLNRYRHDPPSR